MLNTLATLFDSGRALFSVRYLLFEGDPEFITAVELSFESIKAVFRAEPDFDTLAANIGSLETAPDETIFDASHLQPWHRFMGLQFSFAWQMTNQQGYTDGVRFDFDGQTGQPSIIEMVVYASAIRIYTSEQIPRGKS